jgi:hypothetical protein
MAFSIMVQGFKSRSALVAVRGAQVAAVNTMMRYVQERGGARVEVPASFDLGPTGTDYETGGDTETEDEMPDAPPAGVADKRAAPAETGARTPAAPSRRIATRAPVEPAATVPAVEEPLPQEDEAPPSLSSSSSVRAGVGGLGAIAGGDAAPGVAVFADFGSSGSGAGPGIEAAFYGSNFHSVAGPGTGTSEWTRMAAGIGPRYRLVGDTFALDVRAALAAGWFWVHGHDYMSNSTSRTWAVGGGLGARLSWERPGIVPWLGLDAMGWPGRHAIEVVGVSDTRAIPSLDLLMSLGASFRLW